MKYIELAFVLLVGSGGFYLLLDWIVEYLRGRKLIKALKLEGLLDWVASFAVRAAENYGRARGLAGGAKFDKAVEVARRRLLGCGIETEDAAIKQNVGAAYEKLRPTLKREAGEPKDRQ